MNSEINSLSDIPLAFIDWVDLDVRTHTHRSSSTGKGRNKTISCRSGVQTRIGNIEKTVWAAAVAYLAKARGEEWLLYALRQWYLDNAAWCREKPDEALAQAREALCFRLFDRKDWVDYEAFNLKHRPHILEGELTE